MFGADGSVACQEIDHEDDDRQKERGRDSDYLEDNDKDSNNDTFCAGNSSLQLNLAEETVTMLQGILQEFGHRAAYRHCLPFGYLCLRIVYRMFVGCAR